MANTICLTYTVDLYCIHTALTVQEKFLPQFFFVSSVNELINVKRLITRELTSKGHVDLNQQCGNEGGVFMTFFIGIDIAKYKHDGFILDHAGEVIRESFSFTNDRSGFACLKEILSALDSNQNCRIGFESTGHYAMNLKIFLEENGFTYMQFNPFLINRFAQATTLRKTKTDKVDARVIATYLMSVDYKPYPSQSYHIKNLKSLTRDRNDLVKQRSHQLVKLTNLLDLIFPEFKPFFNHSLTSSTCLYLLDHYLTPSKIARMNLESYQKMKFKLRRTLSYARFCTLKQLARDSVGSEDPTLSYLLKKALDLYHTIDDQITEIESLIQETYTQLESHIHTISGIGLQSAACILAEYESIDRFDTADQMLAFAGLEPSRNQSGGSESKGRMVKHGSPYLRQAIMNVAAYSIMHNPILYEFYRKKRTEGKLHRVALSHVAKRIVRLIFHLEKHHLDFDLAKMR